MERALGLMSLTCLFLHMDWEAYLSTIRSWWQVWSKHLLISFCNLYELSGGKFSYLNSIVVFKVNKKTWEEFGEMKETRGFHGISSVLVNDILDHCWCFWYLRFIGNKPKTWAKMRQKILTLWIKIFRKFLKVGIKDFQKLDNQKF